MVLFSLSLLHKHLLNFQKTSESCRSCRTFRGSIYQPSHFAIEAVHVFAPLVHSMAHLLLAQVAAPGLELQFRHRAFTVTVLCRLLILHFTLLFALLILSQVKKLAQSVDISNCTRGVQADCKAVVHYLSFFFTQLKYVFSK